MNRRPISLAAGIMPEASPLQLIDAAAASDFDFGGMWVERDNWTAETTRKIRRMLSDSGVRLLDVEVAWIMPGPPDPWLCELVDITVALEATNLLCVSSDPEPSATRDKLQAMVDRADGTDVRINLEFGLFTEVRTINAARSILEQVEGKNKGLLCDALHWSRSGGTAADIAAVAPKWIGYAQLCDAPAQPPDLGNSQAIIDDAINRRMPVGQGGLKLDDFVDALPQNLPFAIEERSEALRNAFPDLNERAREVARTTRAWLETRS